MQIGHKHELALYINVRGKQKSVHCDDMLPVHAEPLQPLVRSVSHYQFWRSVTVVQPLSVRRAELPGIGTAATNGSHEFVVAIVPKTTWLP